MKLYVLTATAMPAQFTARSSLPNFSLARVTAACTSASDVTWAAEAQGQRVNQQNPSCSELLASSLRQREQRHSAPPAWLPVQVHRRRAGPGSQQRLRSAPAAPLWPDPDPTLRRLPGQPCPAEKSGGRGSRCSKGRKDREIR